MANKRISELTSITGANLADADLLVVVDVSDTTMAASGTNKKITMAELAKDSALTDNLVAKSTLTTNGDLLTRAAGEPARITRTDLAADSAFTSRYVPISSDVVFVGAAALGAVNGSPSLSSTTGTSYNYAAWLLDASSAEYISGEVWLPAHWTTFTATVYWTRATTGAGDVRFIMFRRSIVNNTTVDNTSTFLEAVATANGQYMANVTQLGAGLSNTAGVPLMFSVGRDAANAADTLAGDIAVLGVAFGRQS